MAMNLWVILFKHLWKQGLLHLKVKFTFYQASPICLISSLKKIKGIQHRTTIWPIPRALTPKEAYFLSVTITVITKPSGSNWFPYNRQECFLRDYSITKRRLLKPWIGLLFWYIFLIRSDLSTAIKIVLWANFFNAKNVFMLHDKGPIYFNS